jgi:hypothetical protein
MRVRRSTMRKLSEDSMNCYPRNCPAIFEMDDGRLMVVGSDLADAPPEANVGPGERPVAIHRAVLESAARSLAAS